MLIVLLKYSGYTTVITDNSTSSSKIEEGAFIVLFPEGEGFVTPVTKRAEALH